jgi:hypothetical protein
LKLLVGRLGVLGTTSGKVRLDIFERKKERKKERSFIFATQHILHIISWANYLMTLEHLNLINSDQKEASAG